MAKTIEQLISLRDFLGEETSLVLSAEELLELEKNDREK